MSIDLITSAIAMYNSPDRGYHDYAHIEFCLQQVKLYNYLVQDEEAVRTALFFHDVIYVPGSDTNELESAAWALDYLDSIGASASMGQKVHEYIMDTTHKTKACTPMGQLVQDIDLLGFAKLNWHESSERIRREFDHVSNEVFFPERLKVLQHFYDRPLYHTKDLHWEFEKHAKANIRKEIDSLHIWQKDLDEIR